MVVVYNPLGWKREEVIRIPVSASILRLSYVIQFLPLVYFSQMLHNHHLLSCFKIILLLYCLDFAAFFVYLMVITYMQVAFLKINDYLFILISGPF